MSDNGNGDTHVDATDGSVSERLAALEVRATLQGQAQIRTAATLDGFRREVAERDARILESLKLLHVKADMQTTVIGRLDNEREQIHEQVFMLTGLVGTPSTPKSAATGLFAIAAALHNDAIEMRADVATVQKALGIDPGKSDPPPNVRESLISLSTEVDEAKASAARAEAEVDEAGTKAQRAAITAEQAEKRAVQAEAKAEKAEVLNTQVAGGVGKVAKYIAAGVAALIGLTAAVRELVIVLTPEPPAHVAPPRPRPPHAPPAETEMDFR